MSHVFLGAQDCDAEALGARTGEVSAAMLKEQNCKYVILGHSERRRYHHESDMDIAAKVRAAQVAGLVPIVCVGENLSDREDEQAEIIVEHQVRTILKNLTSDAVIIAYEPVWAIGTGQVPSYSDIAGMHNVIRDIAQKLGAENINIIYGGSVKVDNAAGILAIPGVDGVLLGGAALDADAFISIAKQANNLA
jgi:triosephosphate isomerase